jgi:TldD protein
MQKLLERIVAGASGWIELRYQARSTKRITVRNGMLEESSSALLAGLGVRALVDGVFGFASTTDVSEAGIHAAIEAAQAAARTSAGAKKERIAGLADAPMATGTFAVGTDDPLDAHSLEEKLGLVLRLDEQIRSAAQEIVSSTASYGEIQDEKIIVTSDGASAHIFDSKPELRAIAVAGRNGDQAMGHESSGVTGGWSDLLGIDAPEELADRAARLAVDQLSASHAEGGSSVVVLDPTLVGVLSHEAIGHTVEADIVLGGAITSDKIGKVVASELVTMCDSGASEYAPYAVGILPVDDEGVLTQRTVLIENGVLRSFLHNRETAAHYGVAPMGNARAFVYSDDPIIRMRNTYIEPGTTTFDELVGGVGNGYYLRGLGMSGQADSNAEFMFGVREARRIVDGKVGELVRGVTISGNAFDVMKSVDAVGDDFRWEHGAGACGKGQAAKVDLGGPHVRCTLTIGGRQA